MREEYQLSKRTFGLFRRLDKAEWFCSLGHRVDEDVTVLSSWEEVARALDAMEDISLEAANLISAQLPKVRHRRWNEIAIAVKKIVEPMIERKLKEARDKRELPDYVVYSLQWDIVGAGIESEYSDIVGDGHFADCVRWIIRGHFPCGWKGEFPEGRQVIY